MTKATDIVGYTYQAATWCPEHLIDCGIAQGWLAPGARGMSTEDALDQAQHQFGIDRQDEHTFDSGAFPKVMFASSIDQPEFCAFNGHEILGESRMLYSLDGSSRDSLTGTWDAAQNVVAFIRECQATPDVRPTIWHPLMNASTLKRAEELRTELGALVLKGYVEDAQEVARSLDELVAEDTLGVWQAGWHESWHYIATANWWQELEV
jgi:hypothetical protein